MEVTRNVTQSSKTKSAFGGSVSLTTIKGDILLSNSAKTGGSYIQAYTYGVGDAGSVTLASGRDVVLKDGSYITTRSGASPAILGP